MNLKGKRVAIFVHNFYEDLEFWYPAFRLKEEGADITVIGPQKGTYTSKHGYPAAADKGISEVKSRDFDALVIPGGYAPDHMRRSEPMVAFVAEMDRAHKPIAAICHAGWMLASANVIRGRRVTGFSSIKDDLSNAGGFYEDRDVMLDGNIITSRKPDDLPKFCRALIDAMEGATVPV